MAIVVAGGMIILRHLKASRTVYPAYVQAAGVDKNFGAFPPDIPEYEFEDTDFLT